MSDIPVVVTEIFEAPADKVWFALTNKSAFDKWYFKINDFEPVVGFEFEFYGGSYLHQSRITEIIPNKIIAYTWKYPMYEGDSVVRFKLEEIEDILGNQTKLILTHEGVETFPPDDPNFSRASFEAGWKEIISISLKNYIEGNSDEESKVE